MPTPTKGPRLGGGPAHERLLLANLAAALFTHKSIKTTETKAKRLRPIAERLITFAKRGDLHARRRVLAVIGDKLLSTTTAHVEPGTAKLPLSVGPDWGTGAYVLATLRRPLDVDAKRMPGRAIGVAWFAIDKAAHTLGVSMDLPDRIRPETTLRVPIKLAGRSRAFWMAVEVL